MFQNALGLLINSRSNFQEEQVIVWEIAATFREERIIARKFEVNHRAKRIIMRKIMRIRTIGVTKMQGNFVKIWFQAKFLRKAIKSQEFAFLLQNNVQKHRKLHLESLLSVTGLKSSSAYWLIIKTLYVIVTKAWKKLEFQLALGTSRSQVLLALDRSNTPFTPKLKHV